MDVKRVRREIMARSQGAVSACLARATSGRRRSDELPLVISGFPRSGTTWIAEVIAASAGCGLIFEPLNTSAVPKAEHAGFGWDNFRRVDEPWPQGHAFLDDALHGRVLNSWTASKIPLSRSPRIDRWVVKFVRANPLLAWLIRNFRVEKPLLVVRHPCAVYSSWTHRNWPVADYPPPAKSRFFAAFPEYLPIRDKISTPEEFFAAAWCMEHSAVFRQVESSEYHICYYEQMILNPFEELSKVFELWNIEPPENLERLVKRPSGKASDTLSLDSSHQLRIWQKSLDSDVCRRILDVLQYFDLDMYDMDPLPKQQAPG